MLLWIVLQTVILTIFSSSSASPPGSPQSEESSNGELLIDNPHSEYFHQSPTLHLAQSTNRNDERVLKSKSPSPSLPQKAKENSPKYDSASIQHKLLTDPKSDYYHYFRLLAPKENQYANSPPKESGKQTSSHSVSQPIPNPKPIRSRTKRPPLTDQEKVERYEARLIKQRLNMSDRRKIVLSGDQAKDFLHKNSQAVSNWRQRKKAQDPNFFRDRYQTQKWKAKLENRLGVKIPKEKSGRPRKSPITKQKSSTKKSD